MWALLITALLPIVTEILLRFFASLAQRLHEADMDDEPLASVVFAIVRGINTAHLDWDNDTKWQYAFDAIKQYGIANSRDLKDSLVNVLIELAVQDMKTEEKAE